MFYSSDHCRTSRYLLPAVFKHPSLQANVITWEIVGHSIKMSKEKFTYGRYIQTIKNPTSGNYAKLSLDNFFSAKVERRSSSGPMVLCNRYFPTESTCRQTVYRVKLIYLRYGTSTSLKTSQWVQWNQRLWAPLTKILAVFG